MSRLGQETEHQQTTGRLFIELRRVLTQRIALPTFGALTPFTGATRAFASSIGHSVFVVHGGHFG